MTYAVTRLHFFDIKELVHPDIYAARGERCWELFDHRALLTLDQLRSRYGLIIINDWMWGGNVWREGTTFTDSGLRKFDSTIGAQWSQHKYGRAFDCKFRDVTAEEVRQNLRNRPDTFKHINFIENGKSWFHFDVRNTERIASWP